MAELEAVLLSLVLSVAHLDVVVGLLPFLLALIVLFHRLVLLAVLGCEDRKLRLVLF